MIDFRSDTVTQPCEGMRDAIRSAVLGDDVYGEDPTVLALECRAATMVGMDQGLYVASGTQSNLLALLAHCERGDEYIAGQEAHTYKFEGGGAAVLGSIQPQPLPFNDKGELDLDQVRAAIKPLDSHFARTRLLCLENTQAGKPLSYSYLRSIGKLARDENLALHMDGARLFNAAIATGMDPVAIVENFDSVSICLSKGLGAPVGSVLCGSKGLIDRARRWRKVVGGGMRQAGIIAAAGLFALENNIDRLAEDHRNAADLAAGLAAISGVEVISTATNMVMFRIDGGNYAPLRRYLKERDILISDARLVVHKDIGSTDIDRFVQAVRHYLGGG